MKNNPKLYSGNKVGKTSRDLQKVEKARERSKRRRDELQQPETTEPPGEPDKSATTK